MTGITSARLASSQPKGSAESQAGAGLFTPVNVVILVATAAALALRAIQLARPQYLLGAIEYDDGVYFGSAVRFVHGVLPYRDFTMVQPPGIVLLMTPPALLSKVAGTAWGMAAGRIMTALASTASVALTGLVVRHRGVLATAVATGIMAVYLSNIVDAHTVYVEPWLVLFVLAGLVAVFDGDRITASRRRLAWGGVAMGFGGAVEIWAIFPVLVLAALIAITARPAWLRAAGTFAAGVAVGFCAPVLPFAVIAGRGMYQSIVSSQMNRVLPGRTGLWFRLQWMTGTFGEVRMPHSDLIALGVAAVAVVVGGVLLGTLLARRLSPPLDWFAVVTAAIVVVAFLWNEQFFLHFPAFLAPFLAMALALPVARVVQHARAALAGLPLTSGPLAAGLSCAMIVLTAATQLGVVTKVKPVVSPAAVAEAMRIVPPGACVFTDQASYLIAADRFTSTVPGCSQMVDPLEVGYALGHGREGDTGAARYPAVVAVFRAALTHADFAWLTIGYDSRRVDWTPALRSYFRHNFVPIFTDGRRDVLYVRRPFLAR